MGKASTHHSQLSRSNRSGRLSVCHCGGKCSATRSAMQDDRPAITHTARAACSEVKASHTQCVRNRNGAFLSDGGF